MMADLLARDATAQLLALKAKEISAVELLKLALARHEQTHARLNAVVAADLDRALDYARAADDLRAKNCEVATKNLKALQGDSPVIKTDDKGNKVVLDAQQREAELQRAKKDQDYFCNP